MLDVLITNFDHGTQRSRDLRGALENEGFESLTYSYEEVLDFQ